MRVLLIGATHHELDALRARSAAAGGRIVTADAAVLRDLVRGAPRLPASVDAVVLSTAAWAAVCPPAEPPSLAAEHGDRAGDDGALVEELTAREREVLALVAEGRANREIAARLGISEHTVKFHLTAIFGKLAVSSRTQAVRRALEWGLIEI